jgi:ABC-type uncharacterized transport system fused permease/ATPase subunit
MIARLIVRLLASFLTHRNYASRVLSSYFCSTPESSSGETNFRPVESNQSGFRQGQNALRQFAYNLRTIEERRSTQI